jgi:hypothetical protein
VDAMPENLPGCDEFPIECSAGVREMLAPYEPSGTTMPGRPARRRAGCRHGATARSIGSTSRLPDGQSVPRLSRCRVKACRQARPPRRKTR